MARTWIIACILSAFPLQSAMAQQLPPQKQEHVKPRHGPKAPRVYTAKDLDLLFKALEAAPDTDSGKFVEEKIMRIWADSKSDTVNLLMGRAVAAFQQAHDIDTSIKILSAIIEIAPDYFEARSRRGTLYLLKGDVASALEDIRQVLKREPRHFGVLIGLAQIMQGIGEEKKALVVFRRVLQLYPHIEKIPEIVKKLEEKVEGRAI